MEAEVHVAFLKSEGVVESEVHLILSISPGYCDDVKDEEDGNNVED